MDARIFETSRRIRREAPCGRSCAARCLCLGVVVRPTVETSIHADL